MKWRTTDWVAVAISGLIIPTGNNNSPYLNGLKMATVSQPLQQLCNIIKAIGKFTLIYNFKTLVFSDSK